MKHFSLTIRHSICAAVATALLLLGLTASAQQDRISVESKLDKQSVTIGDRVKYTVIITADTTLIVDSLAVGSNLGAFEIKDYTPRESQIVDGLHVYKESYDITTFTTGDYEIPSLTITYRNAAGEEKSIKTDPLQLTVKSLLTGEEGEDIRPLRGPVEIESPFPIWLVLGGVALLAAAVVFFILYRRAKAPIDLGREPVDTRLPWEVALAELEGLKRSELLEHGKFREFYFRVSEIFRGYLERRYGIAALERTSFEIINEFRALSLESQEEKYIQKLLDESDLVKFAKFPPTTDGALAHFEETKQFVMNTRSLPFTSQPNGKQAGHQAMAESREATQ